LLKGQLGIEKDFEI